MQIEDLQKSLATHPMLAQSLEAVFEKGAVLAGFKLASAKAAAEGPDMDWHVLICDGPTNHLFTAIVQAMQEAQQKYTGTGTPLITQ